VVNNKILAFIGLNARGILKLVIANIAYKED
jgi:hypothetical protein